MARKNVQFTDDLMAHSLKQQERISQLEESLKAIVKMFGSRHAPNSIGGQLFNQARRLLGLSLWKRGESWEQYRERAELPFTDPLEEE